MKLPDTAPAGELLKFARDVTFKHDAASGRVVPTEVNPITAPRLCQLLRETEAEYVRDFDAFAKGGEKVMKKAEIVVILASLLSGLGGVPKPAAGGAAARPSTASARAESTLLGFIKNLLKGGGGKGAQVAVEGVELGGVEAGVQGSRLFVRYSHIINSGRRRRAGPDGADRARARGDGGRQGGRGQDGRGRRDHDRQPDVAGVPRVARLRPGAGPGGREPLDQGLDSRPRSARSRARPTTTRSWPARSRTISTRGRAISSATAGA